MINLHVFSPFQQRDVRYQFRVVRKQKRYSFLAAAMLCACHFWFLLATTKVASLAFLSYCLDTIFAQTSATAAPTQPGDRTISQEKVLFVNPSIGDDNQGGGNESHPLKTITQALKIATSDTVIKLAEGTYSAGTGELFPLILKPGVTIQGNASSKGRNIIITGGGDYLSRSFGSKNVAIVAATKARLIGVTVTNSNPRGYGLWIESTHMTVSNNTFTGSTQDGVMVTGNGAPIISNNIFYRNGANGITITGTSRPQIKENLFQETGFAINIAEKAEPTLTGNQIQNNRSGIVIQAASRPILRNNLIEGNKEDGLVAIAQAQPDLGNFSQAGGNEFRHNGRYDINATAAKQKIVAYGNSIAGKIAGEIDTKGTAVSIALQRPSHFLANDGSEQTPADKEIIFSATSSRSAKQPTPPTTATLAPLTTQETQTNNTIEFVAPQTPLPVLEPVPPGETAFLPATPRTAIPFSSRTNQPKAPTRTKNSSRSHATRLPRETRYRVIAAVNAPKDRELVKSVAPDAFAISWRGKTAMQAGIFSSRSRAQEMLKMLSKIGLKATIEPIEN